jgi:hypothetical protein
MRIWVMMSCVTNPIRHNGDMGIMCVANGAAVFMLYSTFPAPFPMSSLQRPVTETAQLFYMLCSLCEMCPLLFV